MITTRLAGIEDAKNVLPLLEEFFLQTKHHIDHGVPWIEEQTSKVLDNLINHSESGVIIAQDKDGKVIGTTAGLKTDLWLAPCSSVGVELFWYVYPEHRKTRAGYLLFQALEAWAKDVGCDALTMVALDHLEADKIAKVYRRKGYEPIERAYIKRL
tara:strand:+ start:7224 stop:7691 length:468 start_codon:yes stop_codon:yes gene_type:complete